MFTLLSWEEKNSIEAAETLKASAAEAAAAASSVSFWRNYAAEEKKSFYHDLYYGRNITADMIPGRDKAAAEVVKAEEDAEEASRLYAAADKIKAEAAAEAEKAVKEAAAVSRKREAAAEEAAAAAAETIKSFIRYRFPASYNILSAAVSVTVTGFTAEEAAASSLTFPLIFFPASIPGRPEAAAETEAASAAVKAAVKAAAETASASRSHVEYNKLTGNGFYIAVSIALNKDKPETAVITAAEETAAAAAEAAAEAASMCFNLLPASAYLAIVD